MVFALIIGDETGCLHDRSPARQISPDRGGELRRRLEREGFTAEGPPIEIPPGPCLVFRDPGGQRLAVYERVRPGVERSFEGRFDT